MFNIKTLNKIGESGLNILADKQCNVADDMNAAEGILVRSANMHEYDFNPELLAVARAGAGTNNIPIADCTEKGICVFNTPGANAEAVKELAICGMLMASRDVTGGIDWVKSAADKGDQIPALVEKNKSSYTGPEIMGKTLGVIGLGAIGARIANTALKLGMYVYGVDPHLSVDGAWRLSGNVNNAKDLDTIFAKCDYISIHVPYMKATHHMLNADAFAKMKDGVRIINLARGELVDDDAMIEALASGKVAKYVTDFPNEKLVNNPKIIALPHLGASTPESEEKCAMMAARQIVDYLENGNIRNSVNLPDVQLGRMGESRICVIHRNVPKVINSMLEYISNKNINIEHMINKPRGEYAYTMIDVGTKVNGEIKASIESMENVLKVRIL